MIDIIQRLDEQIAKTTPTSKVPKAAFMRALLEDARAEIMHLRDNNEDQVRRAFLDGFGQGALQGEMLHRVHKTESGCDIWDKRKHLHASYGKAKQ